MATMEVAPPSPTPDDLAPYRHLRVVAEMFWDVQGARKSIGNRISRADIDPAFFDPTFEAAQQAEKVCRRELRRMYRQVVDPEIIAWQKSTRGIGEHLLATLLGVIGHPVWTERFAWEGKRSDRHLVTLGMYERRVSDLWSYCGHGDPTRKRAKGMTAEDAAKLGSPRAKTIVYLLACAQIKSTGYYRPVYDAARAKYADREDWSDMHRHNASLRIVGKEILKDLWIVAGGKRAGR